MRDGVPQPPMAAEESRQRAEPRHETEPEAAIRSSGNAIGKACTETEGGLAGRASSSGTREGGGAKTPT